MQTDPVTSSVPSFINLEEELISFSAHHADALYGRYGYYSSGVVQFGPHFVTNAATYLPVFAMLICEHLHLVYEAELAERKRELIELTPTPFRVIELSGGNGKLALQVFTFLKELAMGQVDLYPYIWNNISYTIYEISPVLARQQQTLFSQQSDLANKLQVKNLPAVEIQHETERVSFCFSNELWDALPIDLIRIDGNGVTHITVCVPTVTHERAECIYEFLTDKRALPQEGIWLSKDAMAILDQPAPPAPFQPAPPASEPDVERFALNKSTMQSIENNVSAKVWREFLNSSVKWFSRVVRLEHFPSINAVLTSSGYLPTLKRGHFHCVSSDAIKLAYAINRCSPFAQAHWDYGFVARDGVRGTPRTYGGEQAHALYNFQSSVDITYDVDLRMLATMLSQDMEKQKRYLNDTLVTYQRMSLLVTEPGIKRRLAQWSTIIQRADGGASLLAYMTLGSLSQCQYCVLYVSKCFLPQVSPGDNYPESCFFSTSKGFSLHREYLSAGSAVEREHLALDLRNTNECFSQKGINGWFLRFCTQQVIGDTQARGTVRIVPTLMGVT